MAAELDVTVIMSPREQFGLTRRSLESLYANTGCPFALIYVDGGSPASVRDYLRAESERRGFTLLRTDYFLTPNEARNRGLAHVKTPYVVFVDNDLIFAPNWLESLIGCAKETQADVVTPVVCIGEPVHTRIHFAGGDARIVEENGRRMFQGSHHFAGEFLADARARMVREETETVEFHCVLVRNDVFQRFGLLDEKLTAVHEHTDMCLTVRKHGGKVMFEPASVVTYAALRPQSFSDNAFFYYRWCDEYARNSERYFHEKWGTEFSDNTYRYFITTHRRRTGFRRRLEPIVGWRASEALLHFYGEWMARAALRKRSKLRGAELKSAA